MRIGLFTDQFKVGVSGQVTSVQMLYEQLKKLGHTCYIFTSFSEKIKTDNPDVVNLPGYSYPLKKIKDYRFSPFIDKQVKIIEGYRLDVIHVHTEFYLARAALAAKKKLGIPVVYTLHTMWEYYLDYLSKPLNRLMHESFWKSVRRIVFYKLANTADIIVVPTEKLYKERGRYCIKDNVVIIPTGIDLSRFSDYEGEKKPSDKTVFLYLGRLSSEKEIDVSLTAFANMKNNRKARFYIVGDGPAADELKKLAQKLGIADKLVFTGAVPREETPAYYHNADAFISASKSESQGLTFLEALASRLPIYAIYDGVFEGLVEDGKNGFLCNTTEELTLKMELLCENHNPPSDFKPLVGYTAEEYAARLSEVYEKAIRNNK